MEWKTNDELINWYNKSGRYDPKEYMGTWLDSVEKTVEQAMSIALEFDEGVDIMLLTDKGSKKSIEYFMSEHFSRQLRTESRYGNGSVFTLVNNSRIRLVTQEKDYSFLKGNNIDFVVIDSTLDALSELSRLETCFGPYFFGPIFDCIYRVLTSHKLPNSLGNKQYEFGIARRLRNIKEYYDE